MVWKCVDIFEVDLYERLVSLTHACGLNQLM